MRRTSAAALALGVVAAGVLARANAPGKEPLPAGTRVTRIVVAKRARTLSLWDGDRHLRTYHVSFGANPVGHKEREGDERTPEGRYVIDGRNARSIAHLGLHISYPSPEDRRRAAARGVPPGGGIMIHGMPDVLGWFGRLHRLGNWTDGCIAVTNREMDEIWRVVPDGTPITIGP